MSYRSHSELEAFFPLSWFSSYTPALLEWASTDHSSSQNYACKDKSTWGITINCHSCLLSTSSDANHLQNFPLYCPLLGVVILKPKMKVVFQRGRDRLEFQNKEVQNAPVSINISFMAMENKMQKATAGATAQLSLPPFRTACHTSTPYERSGNRVCHIWSHNPGHRQLDVLGWFSWLKLEQSDYFCLRSLKLGLRGHQSFSV